jgi:hypothetical protein
MVLHGDRGAGYVRVDWFTPDGLGTWGDGRLFVLGTEGYIEVRKYVDIGGRKSGNHLFIVDQKLARYIDCSNVVLPFGPQFCERRCEPDACSAGPGPGSAGDRAGAERTEERANVAFLFVAIEGITTDLLAANSTRLLSGHTSPRAHFQDWLSFCSKDPHD